MQTVFSLIPITDEAKVWVKGNIQSESWQWLGRVLVIEHRFIADIVAGMMAAGLIPNRDFSIS